MEETVNTDNLFSDFEENALAALSAIGAMINSREVMAMRPWLLKLNRMRTTIARMMEVNATNSKPETTTI